MNCVTFTDGVGECVPGGVCYEGCAEGDECQYDCVMNCTSLEDIDALLGNGTCDAGLEDAPALNCGEFNYDNGDCGDGGDGDCSGGKFLQCLPTEVQ